MPNAYASIAEIKAGLPDGIRPATTKYDGLILRLASDISRAIDAWCNRQFYPRSETRYFDGSGVRDLWIPDLQALTSISYSNDDGATYTALVAADYLTTVVGDVNSTASWDLLRVSRLSNTLAVWPCGERSVKIAGVWGYVDERDRAWESTGDTVENAPLAAGGLSLTVNDVAGLDTLGISPRFAAGQLLRIESEYVETTAAVDLATNTIGLLRARNGTSAAAHAQDVSIDVYRAPESIRRACVIQVNRHMERGFQGFGDSRATPELGPMTFTRQWDPEAIALMSPYRNRVHA